MTTQQIMDRASVIAFEMDLYGENIESITNKINKELGVQLRANYNVQADDDDPEFTQTMVKTLLDYENIRYMLESSRKVEDKPMSLEEAIRFQEAMSAS